jgi:hypothetical protein
VALCNGNGNGNDIVHGSGAFDNYIGEKIRRGSKNPFARLKKIN